MAAGLGENDPFARMHDDHRPKYRAYFGLLTLCGTHGIDLSEQLTNLDAEVERVSDFITKTAALLDGIGKQTYAENFLYA